MPNQTTAIIAHGLAESEIMESTEGTTLKRVNGEQLYEDNQGEAYLRKHGFHFGHKSGVLAERQIAVERARREVHSDYSREVNEVRQCARAIEEFEETYGWELLMRAAVDADLTPRQLDCLRGRFHGCSYRKIGDELHCSHVTVRNELVAARTALLVHLPRKSRNRLLWEVMVEVFGADVLSLAGWEPSI